MLACAHMRYDNRARITTGSYVKLTMANCLWRISIWQTGMWQNDIISLKQTERQSFVHFLIKCQDNLVHLVLLFIANKLIKTRNCWMKVRLWGWHSHNWVTASHVALDFICQGGPVSYTRGFHPSDTGSTPTCVNSQNNNRKKPDEMGCI